MIDANQRVFRLIPRPNFQSENDHLNVSKVFLRMNRSMPKEKTDENELTRECSSYR